MESPMKEKKKKKRESKGEMSIGEVQESGTFKLEPSAAPAKKLDTVQTEWSDLLNTEIIVQTFLLSIPEINWQV